VAVNLHHLPDTVRAAVAREKVAGVRVTYSCERTILGTAGGPRRLRRFFDEGAFLLVNGDVVFDFDLERLVARHRATGALATLALRRNPDPRRYASVVTGGDGRVVWLPGARRRRRGRPWLFTGIQVVEPSLLSRLPDGASDTVRDLYAPLVDRDEPVLGFPAAGLWFDLGTPELYRRAQLALLGRRSRARRGSLVDRRARVARSAIVRRSVIGAGVAVGPGARVSGSVLWEGAEVGEGARVSDSIVATGARIAAGSVVRGAVVMPSAGGSRAER
jgi:NDP-sugar pyrophosphorylase family protein